MDEENDWTHAAQCDGDSVWGDDSVWDEDDYQDDYQGYDAYSDNAPRS